MRKTTRNARRTSRRRVLFGLLAALATGALAGAPAFAAAAGDGSAPTALNLWRPGDPGQPLRISGWVRSSDGKPIGGATIHIRQADGTGTYTAHYQGSLSTDEDGSYRFSTVLPGQYYGVKHIHIGATHEGYEYLETQILFKGDPNLAPSVERERAIHLEEATVKGQKVLFGRFDMTLKPIGGD